jgi:uncharacterized membrane protein
MSSLLILLLCLAAGMALRMNGRLALDHRINSARVIFARVSGVAAGLGGSFYHQGGRGGRLRHQ